MFCIDCAGKCLQQTVVENSPFGHMGQLLVVATFCFDCMLVSVCNKLSLKPFLLGILDSRLLSVRNSAFSVR